MQNLIKSLFFALSFVVLFSSCKKEDETDVRDQAEGTYTYKYKMYDADWVDLEEDGTGTMTVKKNANNSATIDFFEGGELDFQGTKVAGASNGLTFDIPSQTTKKDGETMTISGSPYFELAGTKYHGAYESSSKKISIAFKIVNDGETFYFVYEATKK